MEYINEVWRTDLYKLQQQAPKARALPTTNKVLQRPSYYGIEYHGNVIRVEVERIMKNQVSGSYIIRDGVHTPGTFTLVIKFDDSLKNYKLYYDSSTKQHYVGNKYFDKINDLVQDGLIHFYIESRGAVELKKIAECNIYEESPFYKTRYYTLQKTRRGSEHMCISQIQSNKRNKIDINNHMNVNDSQSQSQEKDVILKSRNQYDESRCANNSFHSGEIMEVSTTKICPPIRHSSLISSQNSGNRPRYYDDLTKTFSDLESISESSQDSALENSPGRYVDTSSSSFSAYIRQEAKNSLDESSYITSSSCDQLEHPVDHSATVTDFKSDIFAPTAKPMFNQYINCFADQEKCHNFKIHSFKGPHWCDFCTHFMWGLVAQGVKCQDCGFQAHRKCSDRVPADCLPVMKRLKRVFGVELTNLCKIENRGVPLILIQLISIIEDRGLELEGIYRVSGNAEIIEEVKADLDKDIESVDLGTDARLEEIHNVGSLIKLFFRQLPISLVTPDVSSMLTDLFKSQDNQTMKLDQIKDCLLRLPLVHYATLKCFMSHLQRVSALSDINKMTVENLAIIFAPSLINHKPVPVPGTIICSPLEVQEIIYKTLQSSVVIIEHLIQYCDMLFVDERQI